MGWESSNRRKALPRDWKRRREMIIMKYGGRCAICGNPGNQVDHIIPGDDHSTDNLQLLCEFHHKQKTARESAAARAASPNKVGFQKKGRPPEQHPGYR